MNLAENLKLGPVDRAPYQLSHLLRQLPAGFSAYQPLSKADRPAAEAVESHANNANDTLMHGLAAIGHVLMNAALNDEGGVAPNHLARLGDLITHMAVEAEAMQELSWAVRAALDGPTTKAPASEQWIAVTPNQMPAPEQRVVGWHDELESPVVVFYDTSDPREVRWRVCADGGEFPLDAITHWQHLAPPETGV